MTNDGPLASLPALETEETFQASCQQLSGAGANNNKRERDQRGDRGTSRDQTFLLLWAGAGWADGQVSVSTF